MAAKTPDVFSTHSAARFCRVTPMTIIRWIDEGRIQAYKTPGGHRRIMQRDLEAFCRQAQIPMAWEERVDGAQRVLVVDDDPVVVETLLNAILDGAPEEAFQIEHTNNLFDAGYLSATLRPHLVFLDLDLPGLNARVVAASIRARTGAQTTRVIGIAKDGSRAPVELDDLLRHPIGKRAVRQITGSLPKLPTT